MGRMFYPYFFEENMKFYYCSDLHLDNYYVKTRVDKYYYPYQLVENIKEYKKSSLIIAGDMCVKNLFYRHVDMIIDICSKFKTVLFVEGNHENYKWDIATKFDYSNLPSNFHVLNNNFLELKNAIIYGGTMWADLSELSSLDEYNISSMISDFRLILNGQDHFSTTDSTLLYNKFVENLYEAQLYADSSNKKLIVVSHFAPSMKSVSPGYKGSPLNPYFCNNLDNLIESSNISAWVHGHVHSNHDYMIGNTRILCNPRGYPGENSKRFKLKQFKV